MNSLFLSPRFDTFRLILPKELIPEKIYEKWYNLINRTDKNFFREPIDLINESIQAVGLTGLSDSVTEQVQSGRNELTGRVEPSSKISYRTSKNPLDLLNNEITVTFRHTQGFYTYFLLFESWFWQHAKTTKLDFAPFIVLEILGENGVVLNHVKLIAPVFSSIDALDLNYNKVERGNDTFTCTFKYSDIDFDLGPADKTTFE